VTYKWASHCLLVGTHFPEDKKRMSCHGPLAVIQRRLMAVPTIVALTWDPGVDCPGSADQIT
jgi:hypothetical protein